MFRLINKTDCVAGLIVKNEDTKELILVIYNGNDNIYDAATEQFKDQPTAARIKFCPFCGEEIRTILTDKPIKGDNIIPLSENSFTKQKED